MGYADYFHTVVVGGKVVLEFPLALFLHLAEGNRLVNVGRALLEGEAVLSDVAFPADRMPVPYIIYYYTSIPQPY